MGADVVKVVPAWYPGTPRDLAALGRRVVLRTSWGDPSYAGGARAYPEWGGIWAELAAYLIAIPDAVIEIGNEPSGHGLDLEGYARTLAHTLAQARAAWPRATILPPAHSPQALDRERWIARLAPLARQCDALTIHAYTEAQAVAELSLQRRLVSGALPIWLTEVNYGEPMGDAVRGRRLRQWIEALPVAAALLYHWDEHPLPPLEQQGGAHYRLSIEALRAYGEGDAVSDPEVRHWPALQVAGFAMDVRQWRTVGAFRRHLAKHQPANKVAPWAAGVTLHHTYRPLPSQWEGAAHCLSLAKFYRYEVSNGAGRPKGGWTAGPHLFVTGTAPNAADLGIWQLTPLNAPGIHAASFNRTHWGIEMLGDFNVSHPPADTLALACGAAAALLDWRGLPTASVNGHRDDPKTDKNCPGANVDLATMRRAIDALRGL
jgi:hypothetical protein